MTACMLSIFSWLLMLLSHTFCMLYFILYCMLYFMLYVVCPKVSASAVSTHADTNPP